MLGCGLVVGVRASGGDHIDDADCNDGHDCGIADEDEGAELVEGPELRHGPNKDPAVRVAAAAVSGETFRCVDGQGQMSKEGRGASRGG